MALGQPAGSDADAALDGSGGKAGRGNPAMSVGGERRGLGRLQALDDLLEFGLAELLGALEFARHQDALQDLDALARHLGQGALAAAIGLAFELGGDGEPGKRDRRILEALVAALVDVAQREHRGGHAQAGRRPQQLHRLLAVARRALAVAQQQGEVVLGHRHVGVGRLAVPFDGLCRIALDDEATLVHHADIEGGLR